MSDFSEGLLAYPPSHHEDTTACSPSCPEHPPLEVLEAVLAWEALNPRDPETGRFVPVEEAAPDEEETA